MGFVVVKSWFVSDFCHNRYFLSHVVSYLFCDRANILGASLLTFASITN